MSSNFGEPRAVVSTIRTIVRQRPYRLLAYIVGIAYAFAYMLMSGIIQYTGDFDISTVVKIPWLTVYLNGPVGTVPWVIYYFDKYWFFSMNLPAFLFTLLSSALVGLMAALLFYNSRMVKCECNRQKASGMAALFAGFLAQFSCCGGGVVLLAVVNLLGPAGWYAFRASTGVFILVSLAVLLLSVWIIASRINRSLHSAGSPGKIKAS